MTTRLILVCHAPTSATRAARFPDDEDLEGLGEVRGALGRIDEVRAGPELRCRATATALGVDPVLDPALADLDAGSWRGRGLADLEVEHPTDLASWLTDPEARPHGGESLHDLQVRVGGWLDGLRGRSGRIAAITHPAVIRAVVVHVLRARPESLWRIDVAPLSHTRLSSTGGHWTLRETGHPLT